MLAGVGLAVLFTVDLPEGVELALQGVWVLVVVVLCWGTARSMRHRQRASQRYDKPDGASQSGPVPDFDRRTLLEQYKQPPRL